VQPYLADLVADKFKSASVAANLYNSAAMRTMFAGSYGSGV
jgi:hypothetical protein